LARATRICLDVILFGTVELGQLKNERAVEPLISVLQDPEEEVRRMAALSLVYLKAVAPLIQALKNNNGHVRFLAARALGDIKNLRAIDPLSQLTEDEDSSVRQAAQRALQKIRYRD
jgi:HEAT repeat protein